MSTPHSEPTGPQPDPAKKGVVERITTGEPHTPAGLTIGSDVGVSATDEAEQKSRIQRERTLAREREALATDQEKLADVQRLRASGSLSKKQDVQCKREEAGIAYRMLERQQHIESLEAKLSGGTKSGTVTEVTDSEATEEAVAEVGVNIETEFTDTPAGLASGSGADVGSTDTDAGTNTATTEHKGSAYYAAKGRALAEERKKVQERTAESAAKARKVSRRANDAVIASRRLEETRLAQQREEELRVAREKIARIKSVIDETDIKAAQEEASLIIREIQKKFELELDETGVLKSAGFLGRNNKKFRDLLDNNTDFNNLIDRLHTQLKINNYAPIEANYGSAGNSRDTLYGPDYTSVDDTGELRKIEEERAIEKGVIEQNEEPDIPITNTPPKKTGIWGKVKSFFKFGLGAAAGAGAIVAIHEISEPSVRPSTEPVDGNRDRTTELHKPEADESIYPVFVTEHTPEPTSTHARNPEGAGTRPRRDIEETEDGADPASTDDSDARVQNELERNPTKARGATGVEPRGQGGTADTGKKPERNPKPLTRNRGGAQDPTKPRYEPVPFAEKDPEVRVTPPDIAVPTDSDDRDADTHDDADDLLDGNGGADLKAQKTEYRAKIITPGLPALEAIDSTFNSFTDSKNLDLFRSYFKTHIEKIIRSTIESERSAKAKKLKEAIEAASGGSPKLKVVSIAGVLLDSRDFRTFTSMLDGIE